MPYFVYTDGFVVVALAAAIAGALLLAFKTRRRGKFQRLSAPSGYLRYSLHASALEREDLDTIVGSLKSQFLLNNIDAIIAVDEGGFIVGKLLARELNNMKCVQVNIKSPAARGNASELETRGHRSYLGDLTKPVHFAILVDFDPDEKRVERVVARMKASFPELHTVQKAFVAITKTQQDKIRKVQALPSARNKKKVLWAVRSADRGLDFPW